MRRSAMSSAVVVVVVDPKSSSTGLMMMKMIFGRTDAGTPRRHHDVEDASTRQRPLERAAVAARRCYSSSSDRSFAFFQLKQALSLKSSLLY
mmetsp:Transcript_19669/g.46705  ORF Transcript_19669/g.46705 Transcript_19669/m.46705 type:complete len:92 (-) Transcript_19669:330-605(-)